MPLTLEPQTLAEVAGPKPAAGRARRVDEADRILELARHLATEDRRLVEQVYRGGQSAADLARLARVPVRAMQRRLRRLVARLDSPAFGYVVAQGDLLPRHLRGVARYHILHGRSLRDTAKLTRLSLHRVRDHQRTLRVLAEKG